MPRSIKIVINWLMIIAVIAVNAMANNINDLSTADISDRFANKFVPAGFTFGIWGFIYLLHLLFGGYCTYILSTEKRANSALGQLAQKIMPFFWVACLLNIGWIFAWHHLMIGLSVIIMVALFLALLAIFRILTISEKTFSLSYFSHVSLETPFIIYFSWIAVALIANTAAYLVSIGWSGGGLSGETWSAVMIGIAALIGAWFSLRWHRPAYTAVIMWAIIGIYARQAAASNTIQYAAMAGIGICLVSAVAGFWWKRKLLFKTESHAVVN